MIRIFGIIIALVGLWFVQDGIASVLYYLWDTTENWHFNQAMRIIRILWGIALIVIGVIEIL